MYWNVVEVMPEPHHCLFVRFEDGVAGRVRLQPDELTGALAPLRDEQFFQRVFIDYGVVAWPGEIDLAPDAMYAQIARQREKLRQAGSGKGHRGTRGSVAPDRDGFLDGRPEHQM